MSASAVPGFAKPICYRDRRPVHAVPDGDLAHAPSGMRMLVRRRRRQPAAATCAWLIARISLWPGDAPLTARWRSAGLLAFPRLLVALLWLGLLLLLWPAIGVAPLWL